MSKTKIIQLLGIAAFIFVSCKTPKPAEGSSQPATPAQPQKSAAVIEEKTPQEPVSPELQELPLDPEVVTGTLPNGMKYFIRQNAKPENRMELRLAVNAGSIQEDDDQKGLAHFLEHMAFNGSKNFKENDLIHYVEGIGVQFGPHLNAYTSFDETVYMLQVPTDKKGIIDTALLIMEDWANGLTLPAEEITKEKGVVLSEWRNSLGPMQRMQNEFFPVLFHNSRYPDRLPIGDTATITGANRELLGRFYQDWYRPDLMAVILVGDFDPKEMEQEVIRRFSSLKKVESPRKKEVYPIPPHPETLVKIVTDKEAPYTQAIIFEKHPPMNNNTVVGYRDYLKQQIINTMLNERFKEILQNPAPPFFMAISNYSRQLRNLDAFVNLAIGTSDKVEDMIRTLYEEQYRAYRYGFTQGEFDRALAQIHSEFETALREKDKTESSVYANEYVEYYLEGQTAPGIEIENQLLQVFAPTLKVSEINADIQKLITQNNSVVIITAPERDKGILPSKEKILEIKKEVEQSELDPVEEVEIAANLLPSEPQAGKVIKTEDDEKNQVQKWTLSNGVEVYIKSTDFQNDEILVEAFSKGGTSLYSDEDFYSISNAAPLVGESGYGEFDAISLSRALSGKNVRSAPFILELEEGISATSTPKDFETLLQLIYLNFTAPRKDENAYASYVTKNKSLYSNLLSNPSIYFQKLIVETMYPDNIRRSFPKAEDFDKIDLNKAVKFYSERFANAADFKFVIVGNADEVELKQLVEKYIASLPSQPGEKENWKDSGVHIAKGKVNKTVQMGTAPKTNVIFTYSGTQEWSKDKELLLNVLISVTDIKLREKLREDKGGVYGVGVQSQFKREPSPEYFALITYNVDPPNADDIEKEAMEVIELIKKNGSDETTLNKVKETIKRKRETNLKENSYWTKVIKESANYNEPIEDSDSFIKALDSITNKEIIQAAQTYFSGDNFIRIVMNPEE